MKGFEKPGNLKYKIFPMWILLFAFTYYGCSLTYKKHKVNSVMLAKKDVLESITRLNDKWQTDNNVLNQNAFWHSSAYHIGNMAAYKLTKNTNYLDYTLKWAGNNEWKGAKSDKKENWKFTYGENDDHVLFGDWQACFQVYIDLYRLEPDEKKIARAIEVMDYQMKMDKVDFWFWADGLFMVMPVMTKLYQVTEDTMYLSRLYDYFTYTKNLIFDEKSGFFYRDAKYIYPNHTTNSGKKDFWARGNGWAIAALARVLEEYPEDHVHYSYYKNVYLKMARAVRDAQREEGYWTRSILDPEQAPGPETSGTSFFTFGILWGINNGFLDNKEYSSLVENSWNYLTKIAIQSDGTLGYVQPIGERAIPGQIVDSRSTSDFGVGAFLLAATEMVKYLDN